MALFKIFKGNAAKLPSAKTEGYMYITQDRGDIYVDISSTERKQLNANYANKLRDSTDTSKMLNKGDLGQAVYFSGGVPTLCREHVDLETDQTIGGTKYFTADHIGFINGGETDKFFDFAYGNNPTASNAPGASWRIGALNSGSGNTNYFVIQTGGSETTATTWKNAMRIGMNDLDVTFGGVVTATSFTGNASSATILKTARKINGTAFDGSKAITTAKWGTARTLSIESTAGDTGTSVDGSAAASLIIPKTMTGFTSITSTKFIGALQGNAATATKLATARTISLTGDATGSASFDGSANASITVTITDDSHNHVISNIDGLQTALDAKVKKAGDTMSGALTISKTAADKTSPTSQDLVINYSLPSGGTLTEKNAPGIGFHIGNVSWASLIYDGTFKFVNNNFTGYAPVKASSFTGALKGNADTATKLATARTISLKGDVTGSGTFDGSSNLTITATVADNSHNHISLKGNTDNRDVATTPNDYNGEFKVAGLKYNNKIGSPSGDTYSGVIGFRQWSDNSGGNAHELAFNDSGLYMRSGATTSWGSWEKFITSASIGSQSVAAATKATKDASGNTITSTYLNKVTSTAQTVASAVTFNNTTASSSKTTGAVIVKGGMGVSGSIYGNNVYGAVWNDYAEYRAQKAIIEPGYCVASSDDGQVHKTTKKFAVCDGIVSDTFGFAIGETDKCKTPLAVAGRVLAYCTGNREDYHAGDVVCAGPKGRVMKMTREEIREYPDRIIGHVSEIPSYDTWGTGNIAVNGRIWIKVR